MAVPTNSLSQRSSAAAMTARLQMLQQQRRQLDVTEDETSNDTQNNAPVLLELPQQSYASKGASQSQAWTQEQERMNRTRDQFLQTGTPGIQKPETPAQSRAINQNAPLKQERPSSVAARLQQSILATKKQENENVVENAKKQAEKVKRAVKHGQKLLSAVSKIVSGSGTEVILPLIWLIISLNIESINILFTRINLPDPFGGVTALAGVSLDVDRKRPFEVANLITLFITLFVDFILLAAILPQFILSLIILFLIGYAIAELSGYIPIDAISSFLF